MKHGQSKKRLVRRVLNLTMRVHADGFLLAPAAYIQGIWWRIRGLKLRSRNRIASLTGRSPFAYDLWVAREEPRIRRAIALSSRSAASKHIVPVIDCRDTDFGLDSTIRSLDGAGGVILGEPRRPGFSTIAQPDGLAALADKGSIWICSLHPGDRLASGALANYSAAIEDEAVGIIYADDDLIDAQGRRHCPHFKSEWNPDLFENHDFLSGAAIVNADAAGLTGLPNRGWFPALIRTSLRHSRSVRHVPLVLHHRLDRPAARIPAKPEGALGGDMPTVSVIIPTRNKASLLRAVLDGLQRTDYPRLQIAIIDNGSDEPDTLDLLSEARRSGIDVLSLPGPFNYSALNNAAVRTVSGDFLCFLNNDIEIVDGDWLNLLVRQAIRPDIGAVGAQLLYPDQTIQHAGVYLGLGGGAGHAHRFLRSDDVGYFNRARLPQRISAVTAACMVVARQKFLAVGGFDEVDFAIAFNDVDLCLKLNEMGWQSFYEPRAVLIHHESKSRGKDSAPANKVRFATELAALKRKWRTDEAPDPYHHPHLSRLTEQFCVSI